MDTERRGTGNQRSKHGDPIPSSTRRNPASDLRLVPTLPSTANLARASGHCVEAPDRLDGRHRDTSRPLRQRPADPVSGWWTNECAAEGLPRGADAARADAAGRDPADGSSTADATGKNGRATAPRTFHDARAEAGGFELARRRGAGQTWSDANGHGPSLRPNAPSGSQDRGGQACGGDRNKKTQGRRTTVPGFGRRQSPALTRTLIAESSCVGHTGPNGRSGHSDRRQGPGSLRSFSIHLRPCAMLTFVVN